MTDDPYAMGPPPGYVPPPATKPPPARQPDRWAHLARQALARVGPACRCGHGPATHQHAAKARTDCALCDCTAYHRNQGGSPA